MNMEEINQKLAEHAKWLNNDGGKKIELQGANLANVILECAELRGADLRWTILQNANLKDANLQNAILEGAELQNAILNGANLNGANLNCADLENAKLDGADLRWAILNGANLKGADLENAKLDCADLRWAKLPSRYIQVGCIGSRGGVTTYSFAADRVWCGCFTGTLAEFKERVLKTYPQAGGHQAEYLGLIAYFEALQTKEPPEKV